MLASTRKPSMAINSVHQQEGATSSNEYFDIMLVGMTGLGKTTTADKLLVADPTERDCSPTNPHSQDAARGSPVLQYEDISMWQVSSDSNDYKMLQTKLRSLVKCRARPEPHKEINNMRKKKSDPTKSCELLSNDTSMVRVLDVPGFFGAECELASADPIERAQRAAEKNLQLMRRILHIKAAYNFKFNRIVYFLPQRGPLDRHNQVLQIEIETMERYFGQSVFESMVVIATLSTATYKFIPEGTTDIFTPEDYETTRSHFKSAMSNVFSNSPNMPPDPPIIFLSYTSTCETTLDLIKNARVVRQRAELSFNSRICARCNVTVNTLQRASAAAAATDRDALLYVSKQGEETPYNESTCHPRLQPRHTRLERIIGVIMHLMTLYQLQGVSPYSEFMSSDFLSSEEICIACGGSPGTRGCKRVGAKYFYYTKCQQCRSCTTCRLCRSTECQGNRWNECDQCQVCERCSTCTYCRESIVVDHSSTLENYKLDREGP